MFAGCIQNHNLFAGRIQNLRGHQNIIGTEAKTSQLSSLLWYRNTAGHFDKRAAENEGYTKRKSLANDSREIDMMGKLHVDLAFQNRYLLNGVEGHAKALEHATAKYPLRREEVKSFTIPTGNLSNTKENLFLGQLPTRIVVGLLDNDAYNGVITKSPFNFRHNHINFMTVYRDGVQIPSKPLQPDFVNDCFIRSYMRLFNQTGQYYRDTGNGISREQFKNGCALFAFDLSPQLDSGEVGFELIKHGNLTVEIHFSQATVRTLTAVVFAEHNNLLEID